MNAKLVPLCNGSDRNLGCFFYIKKEKTGFSLRKMLVFLYIL